MLRAISILQYLLQHYPKPSDLLMPRLVFMQYIVDWKSAIEYGEQLSEFQWGIERDKGLAPRIDIANKGDVLDEESFAKAMEQYLEITTRDFHRLIMNFEDQTHLLRDLDKKVIDYVIDLVSGMEWSELIRLVYSTYPLMTQPRPIERDRTSRISLDLGRLAKIYKERVNVLGFT